MTVKFKLALLLLASFIIRSLIGILFKTCKSYAWCDFSNVDLVWLCHDAAINTFLRGIICRPKISFTSNAVDASHISFTTIRIVGISLAKTLFGTLFYDLSNFLFTGVPFFFLQHNFPFSFYYTLSISPISFCLSSKCPYLNLLLLLIRKLPIICQILCCTTCKSTPRIWKQCSLQIFQQSITCWPSVIKAICCAIFTFERRSCASCTGVDVACPCVTTSVPEWLVHFLGVLKRLNTRRNFRCLWGGTMCNSYPNLTRPLSSCIVVLDPSISRSISIIEHMTATSSLL